MIKLLPLGGANKIGASCFYLYLDGTGIILDCGIDPRKTGWASLPNLELLKDLPIDFVFISHAHQDHIGALPFLIKKFPHVIIFSTIQTKQIADLTLHNTVNILFEQITIESDFKIYTHEEIDMLIRTVREISYEQEIILRGLRQNTKHNIKISFFDAGHILGSATILIEYDGHKIFYTGDINLSKQMLLKGAKLPNTKIDTLITEATYAGTDSANILNWKETLKQFALKANKILNEGGSILVPVFALGKTQELLSSINKLIETNKLVNADIFTGGISQKISRVYDKKRYLVEYNNTDLILNDIPCKDIYDITDPSYFSKHPSIVLVSSGMMIEGTISYKLAKYWIGQSKSGIFIVGYMDDTTPGYKILSAKQGDKISLTEISEEQQLNCSVEKFHFPSHSKREDLLRIVEHLNPSRVIIVHGDEESKNRLGFNILNSYKNIKVNSAEENKWIEIN